PRLGAFAAGMATLFAVRSAINHWLWGRWLTNQHAGLGPWDGAGPFAAETMRRIAGLLVDQEYGLLIHGPIYALALVGLWLLRRRDAALARATLVAIACYAGLIVCPITNIHGVAG